MLAAAVGLALAATAVLVLSDSVRWMRLGVLAALWAALAGAFLAAKYRRQIADRAEDAQALRKVYELELEREVAARREFELEAEAEARAKVEAEARDDLAELREELRAMRENLEKLLGGGEVLVERIALRAEATRMRAVDGDQRAVGAGQGAQLRRLTAAKSVPGDAETEMIERIRADAKAQPRKRRPDFTPHPAEVSDRWFIDGPDNEPIDPNWTPSWETGEHPRIRLDQNGKRPEQARPRTVEPLRQAQLPSGSTAQRLNGADARSNGAADVRAPQRLNGSGEHPAAETSKGMQPAARPVQRSNGANPAAETSKGMRPADPRQTNPAPRSRAGQDERFAPETSKTIRPVASNGAGQPETSQAMRSPGTSQRSPGSRETSQGMRSAAQNGSGHSDASPAIRRIPAGDHPAAETSKGIRPVHPAAETSAGMRRAQRVAAGLESPAETSLGLRPDARSQPAERRAETSLGMGRGVERPVETSLGMSRGAERQAEPGRGSSGERQVETSLGMRHAAPEGEGGTRHPAGSAGRSGAWTQDSRRADSAADQRGRHEPPAPQRLSDRTAVEPVDARVARADSEGGRRRAPTGTFPPVTPGRRSAEATPVATGRRAKPEEEEGGRRRRSEGTPPWQDTTTEPAGSHAEGTSVKDLLAAHGGAANTGRRRRRED